MAGADLAGERPTFSRARMAPLSSAAGAQARSPSIQRSTPVASSWPSTPTMGTRITFVPSCGVNAAADGDDLPRPLPRPGVVRGERLPPQGAEADRGDLHPRLPRQVEQALAPLSRPQQVLLVLPRQVELDAVEPDQLRRMKCSLRRAA